jgi:4-oxalocrotonate tautomerase
MPLLTLKVSGTDDPALARDLAEAVTDLTASILRKKRELTSVVVGFTSPALWIIGGRSPAEHGLASFALTIKVTDGTNTPTDKAAYVDAVFAAMRARLGPLHEASYVVVEDVPGEAWGYGGRTQASRAAARVAA